MEEQEFWFDEVWEKEQIRSFWVYEIKLGHLIDDEPDVVTHWTLALNFESAFAWVKDFILSHCKKWR
jgi:hypothetical protein